MVVQGGLDVHWSIVRTGAQRFAYGIRCSVLRICRAAAAASVSAMLSWKNGRSQWRTRATLRCLNVALRIDFCTQLASLKKTHA
jgi:hypothetical protein